MCDLDDYEELGPQHYAIVLMIYESARRVEASMPESHIASTAARRMLEAFKGDPSCGKLDLRHARPHGTA